LEYAGKEPSEKEKADTALIDKSFKDWIKRVEATSV
jgi:hypothetical protein